MTRKQYLRALRHRLLPLGRAEREKALAFCSEMILDKMEDGMTEEAAVAGMDDVDKAAGRFLDEAGVPQNKRRVWSPAAIALAAAGAPLWFPLLIALVAVLFSLAVAYLAVCFALVAALSAVALALGASGFALILASIPILAVSPADMLIALGAGLLCAGMAVLFAVGVGYLARAVAALTSKLFKAIGKLFAKREGDAA